MQTTISTYALEFNMPCLPQEIEKFRGIICELDKTDNPLFHQHDNSSKESKLIDRYPLIQYRSIDNKFCIYSIEEGRNALKELWETGAIKERFKNLKGKEVHIVAFDKDKNNAKGGQVLKLIPLRNNKLFRYRIYEYIPLNNANYDIYKSLPTFLNKVAFLEKMLLQHLYGLAKALNWKWNTNEHHLLVTIDDIDRFQKIWLHNNNFMAIDLVFYTNAQLPDRIAIGNDTAFGKGWLHKQPKNSSLT